MSGDDTKPDRRRIKAAAVVVMLSVSALIVTTVVLGGIILAWFNGAGSSMNTEGNGGEGPDWPDPVPPDPGDPPPPPPNSALNYAEVDVFYGTDRTPTGSAIPSEYYGVSGENNAFYYGVCTVTIPRDHKMGKLESPWKFLFLELPEDPAKHVILDSLNFCDKDTFFKLVRDSIRYSRDRHAFVFVHGYNVTFEDAARRTAQMAYDLGFDGAPIFYSWPSRGTEKGYVADEESVDWAGENLAEFLEDIAERTDADAIHLIAHSMGNRALTEAILALDDEDIGIFKNIILAAPDISAKIFERDIAPKLAALDSTVTMYASSEDIPLKLSKTVHDYRRAGEGGDNILVKPGIDTIDASQVMTDFLAHSYFGDNTAVISDIFYIINEQFPPRNRAGLVRVASPRGDYWRFRAGL